MGARDIGERHVAAGFALLGALVVLGHAWVTEDAFITFRYVSNTLQGHGPVFNVGERVQGFTHPLWFLLLTVGCCVYRDPVIVSAIVGVALTFATIFLVGMALFRTPGVARAQATLGTASFTILCVASDPWLAFQTSGLENSLSNLLVAAVVVESCQRGLARPFRLSLLLSLLCLSRPDLALIALPVSGLLLSSARRLRTLLAIGAGALPLLGWLVFAWLYYGNLIPNTAYAKLGIFADWQDAVELGIAYVGDWIVHDPIAAAGWALFLYFGLRFARTSGEHACAAGIVLHLLWIVWIGGDFMRGRFLLPGFTASLVFGLVLASSRPWLRAAFLTPPRMATVAAILLALSVIKFQQDRDPGDLGGIVNERTYYPGYHLRSYLRTGQLTNPYVDLTFAEDLRTYARRFGPVTIHSRNPGTLGYLSGPEVSVIDTLGLTDAYIARLPRALLIDREPRPGHPDKAIPLAYLAQRGDISFLWGWREAVRTGDGRLPSRAREFGHSNAFWVPRDPDGKIVEKWTGPAARPKRD